MNNEQFRRLIHANSAKAAAEAGGEQNGASSSSPGRFGSAAGSSAPAGALGSRQRSSIPMTPRSVAGAGRVDFARQLAERNNQDRPQKRIRTSAPKGSKFGEGYVDRAKARQTAQEQQEEDEKAARIRALEESLKKEEIDQATFEKLRDEIAGGDLSSTHLIKGLDFKLLERVRKGEDVFEGKPPPANQDEEAEREGEAAAAAAEDPAGDVDDAFEQFEDKEVTAVVKEKTKKKGQLAITSLVPGQKRSRDQILAAMKAAREAAKAKQEESALGSRFKKIGAKKEPGSRIERDAKGREVLIIVDEDGNERRKVRKVAAEVEREREAFKVDPNAQVLGMDVPEYYQKKLQEQQQQAEEEDIKMFSDVESDYDPLQGLESDSDDSDASKDETKQKTSPGGRSPRSEGEVDDAQSPPQAKVSAQAPPTQHPRSYFKTNLISEQQTNGPALNDPSVLAALKKAKTLNAAARSEEEQKAAEQQERLKKKLASADRDADDLDMGFGTNRLEDEEDLEDDGKVKLSAWGGDDDDGEEGGRGGGKTKRKRGPKKRKGDGNNFADVMKVLEKRKTTES
ncbi:hypothetical protein M406DRAFT_107680 [Cryphonectria parasitica EP155]|uniref:RED-like N-terminal domain-containing protein n=1 Tax=Cryphonectria parasitica (strain ATCC 38755 / EP155) TaxID=660469 RepID=A0A9P4Y8Q6_CRYP1|nr:uncharacterized protein M406DRAFT_107680 [Cryphonectria parasitica EP155]KAF3769027.1 hypothetical protein M406DRAFT_107680 [Cryphonectria parasitica EP155]